MKKIFFIGVIFALLAASYAYYLYQKPLADLENADVAYSINADELFSQFQNNEDEANKKYLGKVIQVNGKVKELSIGDSGDLSVILYSGAAIFGINCGLGKTKDSPFKNYKVGDSIKVKGECTGIAMDVVMTRCVIVK